MEIGLRLLFIVGGMFLGILAKQYLTGVYSILFQAMLWTTIIVLFIYNMKNNKDKKEKEL